MGETFFDGYERSQLCDLFDDLGSAAPTLLGSWTTHDLAAHLVSREHDAVAAPGLALGGTWGRFAERRRVPLTVSTSFEDLVETIRRGPPRGFFRLGWVRRFPNLNEFFVHHEDVRRANGRGPRTLAPGEDAALFRNVARGGWFLSRRLRGVGLEAVWDGTDNVARIRRGSPVARLRGSPGELLLYLFGRRDAAEVEVAGRPDAIDAVCEARIGM